MRYTVYEIEVPLLRELKWSSLDSVFYFNLHLIGRTGKTSGERFCTQGIKLNMDFLTLFICFYKWLNSICHSCPLNSKLKHLRLQTIKTLFSVNFTVSTQWDPPTLEHVSQDMVDQYFSALSPFELELELPKLII